MENQGMFTAIALEVGLVSNRCHNTIHCVKSGLQITCLLIGWPLRTSLYIHGTQNRTSLYIHGAQNRLKPVTIVDGYLHACFFMPQF